MILKVNFKDNDFRSAVTAACEDFLIMIENGCNVRDHEKVVENYYEAKKEYSLERIRIAIVKAAYGYVIVKDSLNLYNPLDIHDYQTDIVDYLNKAISIEEITSPQEMTDNNHETCYIDLYNHDIHCL